MVEGTDTEGTGDKPASDKPTRPYEESVVARTDLDAMGNDKRREVVGGQYSASVRKRLVVYGIAVAVMVGVVILSLTVVSNIDNKDIPLTDTAPWTEASASQEPPRDVDFMRNGPQDNVDPEEIENR